MFDPVILFTLAGGFGITLIATATVGFVLTQGMASRHAARVARATLIAQQPQQRVVPRRKSRQILTLFAGLGERLRIIGGGQAERTEELLAAAGYYNRDAVVIYAFFKTVLPVILGLVTALWLFMRGDGTEIIAFQIAIVAGSALAATRAVDAYVTYHRNRRMQAARLAFPDMLELFVIGSEAGLALQPALTRVAGELRDLYPVLSQELIRTTDELRLSNDRKAAFDGLAKRLPLIEIGHFTQTLLQAERHGTPFSAAMRVLMRDQRADRLFRIEEKAARLPVLMTIPLIMLIMPAVFVVLIGPAVLSVLDNIIRGM